MAHANPGARRSAAITLMWLGCAGLTVSVLKAVAWDGPEPAPAGACVVDRIAVGYDVGYVAELGGYGVTTAALSDVPEGCAGREVSVTLHGAGQQSLAEARTSVTAPTTTVDLGGTVPVADLAGVSLALVTDEPGPVGGAAAQTSVSSGSLAARVSPDDVPRSRLVAHG